jgi:hypothetical protein
MVDGGGGQPPAAGKMGLGRRFQPSLADSFDEDAQGGEAELLA